MRSEGNRSCAHVMKCYESIMEFFKRLNIAELAGNPETPLAGV